MIAPYAKQQIFASVSLRDGVRQCRRSSNAVPRHTRTTRSSYLDIFAAGANGRPTEL
jgi:hypothetical protein